MPTFSPQPLNNAQPIFSSVNRVVGRREMETFMGIKGGGERREITLIFDEKTWKLSPSSTVLSRYAQSPSKPSPNLSSELRISILMENLEIEVITLKLSTEPLSF